MRNPRDFTKPLCLGAPRPPNDIPPRPSRMIHFFDPSNPRMASKIPDIVRKVDVLLANLEDAIEAKAAVEEIAKLDADVATRMREVETLVDRLRSRRIA